MKPDLEIVQIGNAESFKVGEHGYPFHTVRWHFHPECELHLVVRTKGRYFVGDFIGEFAPGNLVLTGPNLPHNWVSDLPPGSEVPLRSSVLQFSEQLIRDASELLPELSSFMELLDLSRRGALFTRETAEQVGPMLRELAQAQGIRGIELFMHIIGTLSRAEGVRPLVGAGYHPDPSGYMSAGINKVLAYINGNLISPFSESELAEIVGISPCTFSRSFRRHTGMTLTQYVNRLRINLACQHLMSDEEMSITEACFASGYDNISNFNRQFLRQKGMTPSCFRKLMKLSGGVQATT